MFSLSVNCQSYHFRKQHTDKSVVLHFGQVLIFKYKSCHEKEYFIGSCETVPFKRMALVFKYSINHFLFE